MRVLVTGGAGFIGSHLVDALVAGDHEVVVLDNLERGVHGDQKPAYLNPRATYEWGDIRDLAAVQKAIAGAEVVYHLASLIEVEESQREPRRYADVNVVGTATLLDALSHDNSSLTRLVLASSVAVYGEGAYTCPSHGVVEAAPRPDGQLEHARWEVLCPHCGNPLEPQATPEEKPPAPFSMYGVTKLTQEHLFQAASTSLEIPAVILRFANVYGPRQRPGPYAGVTNAFFDRLRQGQPPLVYEDGYQTRDFIAIQDVTQALVLTGTAGISETVTLNIGTGRPTTVLAIAEVLGALLGVDAPPHVKGEYRSGDIRHLWIDAALAREILGFAAKISLEEGLRATFPPS